MQVQHCHNPDAFCQDRYLAGVIRWSMARMRRCFVDWTQCLQRCKADCTLCLSWCACHAFNFCEVACSPALRRKAKAVGNTPRSCCTSGCRRNWARRARKPTAYPYGYQRYPGAPPGRLDWQIACLNKSCTTSISLTTGQSE